MDIRKFFIRPRIPAELKNLEELAFNIWSCWDKKAQQLFHRLNPQLFRKLNHNPVELLYRLTPERLQELSKDKGLLHELDNVYDNFRSYMGFEGSYQEAGNDKPYAKEDIVAYMCMEYGLHESIPSYSGGLAILAGDHLKAASDIGFPMVSFGLLYRHGYFNQKISIDGHQMEEYRENMWFLSPIREARNENGEPIIISIPLKGEMVWAKIWKIEVGKVPLYLLDTNTHRNKPEHRRITNMLYDPDRPTRLEQELILGRGAIIALRALGIIPKAYHLNEGHTAFSVIERLFDLVKNQNFTLEEAQTIIRQSTIFTTHTPVIEGNEHFDDEMIKSYLASEIKELEMTMEQFLSLGKIGKEKMFWLPAYAMRCAAYSNGVSKLHAEVSQEMWAPLFSTMHRREYPIDSITNGVHIQSWLSLQMTELFDRHVGPDYIHNADQLEIWEKILGVPDGEIWNAHRRRKEQLVSFIRRRLSETIMDRGYCFNKIKNVEDVFNPDYLTIGFARRFAPYKRANLILKNPERLAAILKNSKRPVQIVFSGKAHPADNVGKGLIKQIYDFINQYSMENHVVFIEDYDMNVARHLVEGVDIWLNTPVRPMEASGTSGIKAAINGALNLSILDGWWPEAYNGQNGWAIHSHNGLNNPHAPQDMEVNQIYELLEGEITDLYYSRGESDIPAGWVKMMKNAIVTVCHQFSMHRALHEYINRAYLPQIAVTNQILSNNSTLVEVVEAYKQQLDKVWPKIALRDYFSGLHGRVPASGDEVTIDAYVYLDNAPASLIQTELFYCFGEERNQYRSIPLEYIETYDDKVAKFSAPICLEGVGLQEVSVRIVPANRDFRRFYPDYMKWKE